MVQAANRLMYGIANGQLSPVHVLAELYMEVGLSPCAKYAIMSPKKVPTLENVGKLTYTGLRLHLHFHK